MADLTDTERLMLDFERRTYLYPGSREQAIRDEFALAPQRYLQQLNTLIDRPEALAFSPQLVKRLRRRRSVRGDERARRARSG